MRKRESVSASLLFAVKQRLSSAFFRRLELSAATSKSAELGAEIPSASGFVRDADEIATQTPNVGTVLYLGSVGLTQRPEVRQILSSIEHDPCTLTFVQSIMTDVLHVLLCTLFPHCSKGNS